MTWIGDYPEDFTTVPVYFTTHDGNGAPVAPSTAFEAADVIIYKNGSATQKTTTNGVTMTSPFDSITGLHQVLIDTSNDTGDAAFWVAGAVYTVVLSPDETVNSQAVAKVLATFGLRLVNVGGLVWDEILTAATHNIATSAGRRLRQVTALTTVDSTVNDAAATTTVFITSLTTAVDDFYNDQLLIFTSGNLSGQARPVLDYNGTTKAITVSEAFTSAPANGDAFTIQATHIHPITQVATGVWDEAVDGAVTARQSLRLQNSLAGAKLSGGGTATEVIRDLADTKDRITATVDASGNRTAVTRDLT